MIADHIHPATTGRVVDRNRPTAIRTVARTLTGALAFLAGWDTCVEGRAEGTRTMFVNVTGSDRVEDWRSPR
jgi:hypothetical protein